MEIRTLRQEDAHPAALLHIEGQPGTFLTALGPNFLDAFYTELGASTGAYGFVAVEADKVIGVVVGTTDTHALFKEIILKHGLRLALPALLSVLRHPGLFFSLLQSLFYPNKLDAKPGEAELLFIGIDAQARRHHIGTQLINTLIEESRRRGATALKITVDVGNPRANAFYQKNGLQVIGSFSLNGRKMNLYYMPLFRE
jgi:ribosomal protein S18 acetylase RimI-like enzyme